MHVVKIAFHKDGVTYPAGQIVSSIPDGCDAFCEPAEDNVVQVEAATAAPGERRTSTRKKKTS